MKGSSIAVRVTGTREWVALGATEAQITPTTSEEAWSARPAARLWSNAQVDSCHRAQFQTVQIGVS
eukprot:m.474272 g.474272  ORF g.474272 m.474272 type:complete len:66 (-) comp36001_c0_seq1:86-283(-)